MMVKEGLSTSCAQDLLAATIAPSTKKRYQLQQRDFTNWMRAAGHDPDEFSVPLIVEFLYNGWTKLGWSASTVNVNKCAVLDLYDVDNSLFNNHRYAIQLSALVKRRDLKVVKDIPVDISPVLALFRSWGPNESLSLENLTSKTVWLLGVAGFMRPDNLRCVDIAKSRVRSNGTLSLCLLAPKEKTGGSSVETVVFISLTQDPLICPVQAYSAYLKRLPENFVALPHFKATRLIPRPNHVPLFRHVNDLTKPIRATTISVKQREIT